MQGEASAATLGVAMGVANTAMGVAITALTLANVTVGVANNTLVPKELKRCSSHPSRESSLCESVESNGTSFEGRGRRMWVWGCCIVAYHTYGACVCFNTGWSLVTSIGLLVDRDVDC